MYIYMYNVCTYVHEDRTHHIILTVTVTDSFNLYLHLPHWYHSYPHGPEHRRGDTPFSTTDNSYMYIYFCSLAVLIFKGTAVLLFQVPQTTTHQNAL